MEFLFLRGLLGIDSWWYKQKKALWFVSYYCFADCSAILHFASHVFASSFYIATSNDGHVTILDFMVFLYAWLFVCVVSTTERQHTNAVMSANVTKLFPAVGTLYGQ